MNKCVLFIHGLGSSTDIWHQLKSYLERENKNPELEFKCFGYKTKKLDEPFSLTRRFFDWLGTLTDDDKSGDFHHIDSLAMRLETEINSNFTNFGEIEIVAHSMGGLIATRYILNQIERKRNLKIKRIIYICTPFVGSYFANVAKLLRIGSYETNEMTTKSKFLKKLMQDKETYNFNDILNYQYIFGVDDAIIKEYRNTLNKSDGQITLDGDHSTILTLGTNFLNFRDIIFEKTYDNFIDKLYSKAILNDNLRYSAKYIRKIKQEETRNQFSIRLIDELFDNENDEILFNNMNNLINNHSYSPHINFEGEKYFTPIETNNTILKRYWEKIKNQGELNPFLYIGNRGSGKTITQNMWIHKNFKEMEELNIFHVRCDVHKIYQMLHKSILNLDYNNLSIESYLNMQFLYIFLKYRDGKYNAKNATSKLMKNIYNLLLQEKYLEDIEIVATNKKFSNLGDFLDKQSNNIFYSEVEMRNNDKNYSYALELMKNITGEETIPSGYSNSRLKSYTVLIKKIILHSKNLDKDPMINNFLEFMNIEKNELISKINSILENNIDYSEDTKIREIEAYFSKYFDFEYKNKSTTTKLWQKVSLYIQEIILSHGYKILKLIDGIDNIIINETVKDKKFFNNKLIEICDIVNSPITQGIYHLITLRDDTYSMFEEKQKEKNEEINAGYSINSCNLYSINQHSYVNQDNFFNIKLKRFESLKVLKDNFSNTLYSNILEYIFTKYKETDIKLINTHQIRMLLRNMLFLSLQVYFEFKRRKIEFNSENCSKYIKRRFKETFFLRNYPFIETKSKISSQVEDTYKVFPNIFYFHNEKNDWIGFCNIRILQYLRNSSFNIEHINKTFSCIYEEKDILKSIETLLDYNLIASSFKLNNIEYKTTNKGIYFFELINNLDVLYYLSLDTPLPEKFVTPTDDKNNTSYFSIFDKKLESTIDNSGYGNAIIKSVSTFVLFLRYIHEQELMILKQNLSELEVSYFQFPIEINEIEDNMKDLYKKLVENNTKINDYFKLVGLYEENNLNADLKSFRWID